MLNSIVLMLLMPAIHNPLRKELIIISWINYAKATIELWHVRSIAYNPIKLQCWGNGTQTHISHAFSNLIDLNNDNKDNVETCATTKLGYVNYYCSSNMNRNLWFEHETFKSVETSQSKIFKWLVINSNILCCVPKTSRNKAFMANQDWN